MSLFGNDNYQPPTDLNGLRLTEAVLGRSLPILIGQQRIAWKLFWYGAFKSWQPSQGGSGLVKGGSSYVYSASVLGGLCMGPCSALLGVWSNNGKFDTISYSETYVVSGTYIYTPVQAEHFQGDLGVGYQASYNVTVNDYGSPGSVTKSGTQQIPLQYTTNPTPGPGQYTVNGSNQYVFNAAQNGETVVVNYITYRYHIDENELDVIPLTGPYQITVQYQTGFAGDRGVSFYPSGIALTPVSGTPTLTGTYNPNGGNYLFAAVDAGLGVVIDYAYSDPNYDPNDPTGKLNLTFFGGGLGQTPWSYLSGSYPSAAIGYSEVAYVASSGLYLGYSAILPQMNFEVIGPFAFGNGIGDANPADAMYGLMVNPAYKFNFNPSWIHYSLLGLSTISGGVTTGTFVDGEQVIQSTTNATAPLIQIQPVSNAMKIGPISSGVADGTHTWVGQTSGAVYTPTSIPLDSSAKAMWTSNNFFISAILDSETSLMDIFSNWCEAGQVFTTWDEGQLKFIPLVDTTTIANGAAYYPPTQPVIDLDDNDFVKDGDNKDPITIEQTPWQNRWNRVRVRWSVRSNDYNQDVIQFQDEAAIQDNDGILLSETPQGWQFLCTQNAALWAATMRQQRFSAIYTKFKATLKSNFAFLSPGDIITVTDGLLNTSGTMFGRTPIRLTSVNDDPEKGIEIEAEDFPWSVGTALLNNVQAGIPSNTNDGPQEDPGTTDALIIEVPNALAQYQGVKVYIFANGGVNWGGYQLWISYDGVDYRKYGQFSSPSTLGVVADDFPLHADPDLVDTLTIVLGSSNTQLQSVSEAAWNAFTSICALLSPGQALSPTQTAQIGVAIGTPGSTGTSETEGPLSLADAIDVPAGIGLPWTNPGGVTANTAYASVQLTIASPTLPNGVYLKGLVNAYFWNNFANPQGSFRPYYPLSTGTAGASAQGNSLMFNTPAGSFGDNGDPNIHPMQWATINASGAITGFTQPYLGENGNSYNMVLTGTLHVPAAGTFIISINHDDGMIFAIQGATIVSAFDPVDGSQPVPDDPHGHTETAVMGYAFASGPPVGGVNGQGYHPEQYSINFPSAGDYNFEIDFSQLSDNQMFGLFAGASYTGSTLINNPPVLIPATVNQNFSDYIAATNPGFEVPSGSNAIIGVQLTAEVYCSAASGSIVPNITATLTDGSPLGTPVALEVSALPTTPTLITIGSLTSLAAWNLLTGTLTSGTVNAEGFGVALQAVISGTIGLSSIIYIKNVQLEVAWQIAGSVIGWTNPQNVSSISAYASAVLSATQAITQWLFAYNFNFQLPFGFILAGIVVEVNAYTSAGEAQVTVITVSEEQRIGSPKSVIINNIPTDYAFGSNIDQWGSEDYWDVDNLNEAGISGFGVMISVIGNYSATMFVNNVRVTLYGTSTTNLELIAYEDAELVGNNTYALTNIHRGIMGSYPCDHPTGALFAKLDQAAVDYLVPSQYLGSTIYFKFLSFNAYGNQLQSLSDVTAYAVPIQGLAPGAIDGDNGALLTGTPNFGISKIETALAAVHGAFGIQNIPTGYILTGPIGQLSGTPQWVDGTTGAGGGVNDYHIYIPPVAGTYGTAQELFYEEVVRVVVMPSGLGGSQAGCRIAPTANLQVGLYQNGVLIGTVNFTAGNPVPTFTFTNSITFFSSTTVGGADSFSVVAPTVVDHSFAGFWMVILAARLS